MFHTVKRQFGKAGAFLEELKNGFHAETAEEAEIAEKEMVGEAHEKLWRAA